MGEHLEVSTRLEDVVGPKQTGLGEGWFVTTVSTWWVGDEAVGTMRFRVLKFRPKKQARPAPHESTEQAEPAEPAEPAVVLRPAVNRDTAFFWEGTGREELRIQCCQACGALRHPPGPLCTRCGSTDRGHVVASGRGTVYSYVVHHHPPVPGKELPLVIVLVELEEGVRMLGELLGSDPDTVEIGQPVVCRMDRVDDELTLPAWVPAGREEQP
jgi:uncharacterized OB-fold protein